MIVICQSCKENLSELFFHLGLYVDHRLYKNSPEKSPDEIAKTT